MTYKIIYLLILIAFNFLVRYRTNTREKSDIYVTYMRGIYA